MASRMLRTSLGVGGRAARCSPARHANATMGVSLTQMYHAAFTSPAVNNGDADAAPATATASDKDREVETTIFEDPVSRAAEKAADVGRKVKGTAEEVKEAGRQAKDGAKEVAEDVKESIKHARP